MCHKVCLCQDEDRRSNGSKGRRPPVGGTPSKELLQAARREPCSGSQQRGASASGSANE